MADLSIWMIALLALIVASPASTSPASASASPDSASTSTSAAEGLVVEAMKAATSGQAQEIFGWIRKGIDPSYEVKDDVPLAQLLRIMQDSSAVVRQVLFGLNKNFQMYFLRLYEQQLSAYEPPVKEFYNAIPAENFKKMWLQILRTAQRLTQNQCGIFELMHNPLHPLKSLENATTRGMKEKLDENREKYEADISASDTAAATLTQLGHAIAFWMANVDDGIGESIANASAKWCLVLDQVLIWTIAKLENTKPEDVKGKWE